MTIDIINLDFNKAIDRFGKSNAVLLVVANHTERDAVLETILPLPDAGGLVRTVDGPAQYYLGLIGEFLCIVVTCSTRGSGTQQGSIITTKNAIRDWSPSMAVLTGIACGNPTRTKVKDVVVAEVIVPYESARVSANGEQPEGATYSPNVVLRNIFGTTDLDGVKTHQAAVLSGEKLVDDIVFRDSILKKHGRAYAIEMEGSGFAAACEEAQIPWIVSKAISDFGDGNKDSLRGSRKDAALVSANHCQAVFEQVDSLKNFGQKPYLVKGRFKPAAFDAKTVLSAIHGKQCKVLHEMCDTSSGVIFEYAQLTINLLNNVNYLFLGAEINVKQTLKAVAAKDVDWKKLTIVAHRVRQQPKTIRRELEQYAADEEVAVSFLDEILWEAISDDSEDYSLPEQEHYIDQSIDQGTVTCRQWFKNYLTDTRREVKPAVIVSGRGGVGKTWLCNDLESLVLSQTSAGRKRSFIRMNAADLLQRQPNTTIASLADLYKHHIATSSYRHGQLNPITFEMSVSVGNVVVIIDGLDELAAAPNFDFELEPFIKSLEDLNSDSNCRVIATVRDLPFEWDPNNVEPVQLKGFGQEDVDIYLDSIFESPQHRERVRNVVRSFRLDGERFLPLALKLICDQLKIEADSEEMDVTSTQITGDILIKEETLDEVIYGICNRETNRKKLNVEPSNLVYFYAVFCDEENGRASFDTTAMLVKETLEFKVDELEKAEKLINQNVLLERSGDTVSIKYEPLIVFFQARMFYQNVQANTLSIRDVKKLSGGYKGGGPLFEELQGMFKLDEHHLEKMQQVLAYLREAQSKLADAKSINEHRRAISALLYLYFKTVEAPNRTVNTENLIDLYGGNVIEDFYVWGPLVPLDFSKVTVRNGELNEYTSLYDSKPPSEGNTAFYNVPLQGMNENHRIPQEWLSKTIFDKESFERSEDLNRMVKAAALKEHDDIALIVDDLLKLINKFFDRDNPSKKSKNIFSRLTTLKYVSSAEAMLKKLVKVGFVDRIGQNEYEIRKEYFTACREFKNNRACPPDIMKVAHKVRDLRK